MIFAIVNMKGGVGKTTTTVNLSAALAAKGKSVLVVDLDAQGNTTSWLGSETPPATSIADALRDRKLAADAIAPTRAPGVDLLYGSREIVSVRDDLRSRSPRPANALQGALRTLKDYDFVLIDCPPGLDLLQINAIVACDRVIVPIDSQSMALSGLTQISQAIDELVDGEVITQAPELRILITMYDGRMTLDKGVVAALREQDIPMYDQLIRVNTKLAECYGLHETIFTYAPKSAGAEDYLGLAQEIVASTAVLA